MGKAVRRYIPLGGFVCLQLRETTMHHRLQKYLWRMRERALPDGPPFILATVILLLLIVNGLIWLLR
jgi:hypothetical protein